MPPLPHVPRYMLHQHHITHRRDSDPAQAALGSDGGERGKGPPGGPNPHPHPKPPMPRTHNKPTQACQPITMSPPLFSLFHESSPRNRVPPGRAPGGAGASHMSAVAAALPPRCEEEKKGLRRPPRVNRRAQNPRAEALRSPVLANAAAARRNRRRAMRCGPTADSGQRAGRRDARPEAGENKRPALKARPGHPAGMRLRPRAPPREAAESPRA